MLCILLFFFHFVADSTARYSLIVIAVTFSLCLLIFLRYYCIVLQELRAELADVTAEMEALDYAADERFVFFVKCFAQFVFSLLRYQ